MISYDDLVVALQAWRVKQGLPVGQLSGTLTPPPAIGKSASPPPAPPRPATAPPKPPASSRPGTPPPLRGDESIDADADVLLANDTVYDSEGADFALSFAGEPQDAQDAQDESTQIGGPPSRPSERTAPGGLPLGGKPPKEEW